MYYISVSLRCQLIYDVRFIYLFIENIYTGYTYSVKTLVYNMVLLYRQGNKTLNRYNTNPHWADTMNNLRME